MVGTGLFALVIALFGALISLWITYLVIKAAIRDGIKESGLTDAVLALQKPPEESKLLPMWAER